MRSESLETAGFIESIAWSSECLLLREERALPTPTVSQASQVLNAILTMADREDIFSEPQAEDLRRRCSPCGVPLALIAQQ
jgi:hypothetical protein